MQQTYPAGTLLYRYTAAKRKLSEWQTVVLGGRGTHFGGPPGRYHVDHLPVYLTTDPRSAVAEAAYYSARHYLDEWLPDFRRRPLSYPFVAPPNKLWCFRVTAATTVVDVEHPGVCGLLNCPPLLSLNPGQRYAATQWLAAQAVTAAHPPLGPPPRAGIQAPSVRARHRNGTNQAGTQTVLYTGLKPHQLDIAQAWDFGLEFLDPHGQAVGPATGRVEWERVRVTVGPPALAGGVANLPHFPAGRPTMLWVSHS